MSDPATPSHPAEPAPGTLADRIRDAGLDPDTPRSLFLGGVWIPGDGPLIHDTTPIDGSPLARVTTASAAQVDSAVAAAAAAFRAGVWRGLRPDQRARVLHRAADLIEAERERLAVIQTLDNGKTLAESLFQADAAAETFRYFAALIEATHSAVVPARGEYFGFTEYEPVGVVAAITPWNSPLTHESLKIAPALAAGNSVVAKPSEVTPLISLEYARILTEAGVPAGVFSVVQGIGPEVGARLVGHPEVDLVSFTGGGVGGRAVAAAAAARLIPAIVELGGKSPNIVFADADLDAAVDGATYGIYSNGGQSCIAGSRILVQDAIYDDFVSRLAAKTAALTVGDPFDSATAIAPLSSFPHRDRVLSLIDAGVRDGGRVLAGGGAPTDDAHARGAYVSPTLIEVDSNRSALAQQEVFGPVAVVLRFRDEADLVEIANDTAFGLACGIWTADHPKALRTARAVRAGSVWINTYKIGAVNMPFGGFKDSGIGREAGLDGLRTYQEVKSVYVATSAEPFRWPRP